MAQPEYVSPSQAGKIASVHHKTMLTFIENGQLEAVNISTKPDTCKRPTYRIAVSELQRFLRSRSTLATQATPTAVRARKPRQARFYA